MPSPRVQSLEASLTLLSERLRTTSQLINRLSNLKFQPGSTPAGDGESSTVLRELTAEIHDGLKRTDDELEILRQEVQESGLGYASTAGRRDSERDKEQARLSIQIARLGEDYKHARASFRRAQVQSKRNAAAARAQERDLLFTSKADDLSESGTLRRRTADTKPRSGEDEAAAASRDVTAGLLRTKRLLETEVQRSYFAQETYEQSKDALAQLSETYTGLDDLLQSSRTLLGSLVSSQKSDTWYLETAFYVLATTIAWLVFRRFLYGPFWWFAWLPLKLVYRLAFTVLGVVGLTGGSPTTSLGVRSSATSSSAIVSMSNQASLKGQGDGFDKVDKNADPSPDGSLSQEVGQMAEKSAREAKEPIKRGDGTVLEDSEQPRNPKKRMFDTDAEKKKQEAGNGEKDEL